MTEPFLAEVRMMGFSFAPKGWAQCNGQIMAIAQNTALFSLLGVNFGGDGRVTFGLPGLANSVVVGAGTSAVGSEYDVGQTGGSPNISLTQQELPAHAHAVSTASFRTAADSNVPIPTTAFATAKGNTPYVLATASPAPVAMAPQAIPPTGGGVAHNNMMPFCTINFCIALEGVFPQRP